MASFNTLTFPAPQIPSAVIQSTALDGIGMEMARLLLKILRTIKYTLLKMVCLFILVDTILTKEGLLTTTMMIGKPWMRTISGVPDGISPIGPTG